MPFSAERPTASHTIRVCVGASCSMNFSADVLAEAEDSAFSRRDCEVQACGCLGSCEEGPNLSLDGQTLYDMSPEKVRSLVDDLARARADDARQRVDNVSATAAPALLRRW